MSRQVIMQPDGKFAVWSSIVDDWLVTDATEAEIVDVFKNYYTEDMKRDLDRIREKIDALKAGKKPYYQFTLTWEEANNVKRRKA